MELNFHLRTTIEKSLRFSRLALLHEPMGYVQGADLYQFVDADPVNNTDPTGLVADGDVTVDADPKADLDRNVTALRAQMTFHGHSYDESRFQVLENEGIHIYTYVDVNWSVADLRGIGDTSADGFYRYYIEGAVKPNFEFFMTRHQGQHGRKLLPGQNPLIDQSTFDTDGSLSARFSYVGFCTSLKGFNPPLGGDEQGVASEQNSPTGSPNRFQSFPGFRVKHSWFDGNGQAPESWSDGTAEETISVSLNWKAAKGLFKWRGSVATEDFQNAKLSSEDYGNGAGVGYQ